MQEEAESLVSVAHRPIATILCPQIRLEERVVTQGSGGWAIVPMPSRRACALRERVAGHMRQVWMCVGGQEWGGRGREREAYRMVKGEESEREREVIQA